MHRYALVALLSLLAFHANAGAAEPALQPQHGVLVLRNGQLLEGDITPTGDYYFVGLGKTGQVRMAAKEVEMVCRSAAEAYQRKAAAAEGKSAAVHCDLAAWCLRQSMMFEAQAQLAIAREISPTERRIAEVEQRIKLQTSLSEAAPAKVVALPTSATVGAPQLERTMKELPPGCVERYTAVIQPILIQRCGNASCHGRDASPDFQLLSPIPGKVPSRRFTQRNLFSTLAHVNKESPDESHLLSMALKSHGPTDLAPFKSDEDRQYRELAAWVRSVQAVPKGTAPATVNAAKLGSLRPQIAGPSGTSPASDKRTPADAPTTEPAATVDPFDPEVFNRRYHAE
jgi:hypothetical protein